ncbi:MAG TPA: ribosome maturation factor RimM [Aggregatilineales bacterium]|nr:ribosome maturation factor RimM [Aggregatilineales bacterium]
MASEKSTHQKNSAQSQPDVPGSAKAGPQYLVLAQILRPHGVRGDLIVKMMTAFPERMSRLELIYLGINPASPRKLRQKRVTWAKRHKADQWLLHFDEIEDRDAAELLRKLYMFVSLEDAVPLEDDEIYLFQLIGLEARTVAGELLGRVEDIIETGANDVYVIRGGPYGEVLIPAIPGVVRNINVEAGTITVEPLPGLLPDLPDKPSA